MKTIKFKQCPKVGDQAFGPMLKSQNDTVIEKKMIGTVYSVQPSANEGLMMVFVECEEPGWGVMAYWENDNGRFEKFKTLEKPYTQVSEALDNLKVQLDRCYEALA